ncbi:MAG: AAA family ATPase [Planctomycetota bacterium]
MLTSLELEKYRGFQRYRLGALAPVNLLVGKNNCGKTSLLEAVQFSAAAGHYEVLFSTAWQRGEVVAAPGDRDRYGREMHAVLSHFFYGHELEPGTYFTVRTGNGLADISVRISDLPDIPDIHEGQQRILPFGDEERSLFEEGVRLGPNLAIRLDRGGDSDAPRTWRLPISADGVVPLDALRPYRRGRSIGRDDVTPVQFITPDSLEPRSMSDMWDQVITDGRESEVIEAMRILAPGLTSIHFLSAENAYRGRAGVLAAFEGSRRRAPLGSYGDGMRRLLALSLSLIRSEGGVLLVDEIDTGLHYSIMGDMWRLVTEAARRSNVQVFATTHSSDCVRGLAWLCENHPNLADDVAVQKIDCELEEAVALHADQITLAVNQGMEVR